MRNFFTFSILIRMNLKTLTLPSFAKINLFLRIFGKRSDNFHEISTAFQTVSLHDILTFSESDELILTSNDERIPTNEKNLILKAAELLREKTKQTHGARIHLEKNIPFPGGLGGGSSNAAIALLGLSTLWKLDISFVELLNLGKKIGSDVPFFFYGGTAIGKGRGTEILSVKDYKEKYIVIIAPNIEISTARAYKQLNAQDLTNIDSKSILKICREDAERLESGHLNFINDFEESVFEIEPEIKSLKSKLLDRGAETVLLSGSGASVFAIFDNENKRQKVLKHFQDLQHLRAYAVETVSRDRYREFLKPCEHLLPKNF